MKLQTLVSLSLLIGVAVSLPTQGTFESRDAPNVDDIAQPAAIGNGPPPEVVAEMVEERDAPSIDDIAQPAAIGNGTPVEVMDELAAASI
jgi:hypothetical protein